MHEELTISPNNRKNLSDLVLICCFLPLAEYTGVSYGFSGLIGGSAFYLVGSAFALVAERTFLIISITDFVKGLKSGTYEFPDVAAVSVGGCSYNKM